jgi:hypothetical protein
MHIVSRGWSAVVPGTKLLGLLDNTWPAAEPDDRCPRRVLVKVPLPSAALPL